MTARNSRWQPGQSGNPKGRPSIKGEVETLARSYTSEALETLADLMRNGASDSTRMAAANALLNRGWGLPRQAIDGSLAIAPAPPKPIERMSLAELEAELAMLNEKRRLADLEEEERLEQERLTLIEGTVNTGNPDSRIRAAAALAGCVERLTIGQAHNANTVANPFS